MIRSRTIHSIYKAARALRCVLVRVLPACTLQIGPARRVCARAHVHISRVFHRVFWAAIRGRPLTPGEGRAGGCGCKYMFSPIILLGFG